MYAIFLHSVIYGESGPESILGALARSIVLLASKAREQENKLGLLSPSHISSRPCSVNNNSTGNIPLCTMTEVQAVAHTMDILLACNRTQSGGDTYYCVEYLFRNPSLVVICPYSSHAEPLQVCWMHFNMAQAMLVSCSNVKVFWPPFLLPLDIVGTGR